MHYADTGFLLSLYLPETTSAAAARAMRLVTEPLPVIPLGLLEFRNGLRLAVFRRHITEPQRAIVWRDFEQDLRAGVYVPTTISMRDLWERANLLVDGHSAQLGTRTLDVLHVAAALIVGATDLLSFDRRQKTLATAEGMHVGP